MITSETLLGAKVVGAILGGAAFLVLFVVVGFMKLPIPLNFGMTVVGILLGWYVVGRALADRDSKVRRLNR